MGRHPNIIRPVRLHTTLREDTLARLRLHFYSEALGRVPQGAIQEFLEARIAEYFDRKSLDLFDWSNKFSIPDFEPGKFIVYGSPAAIAALKSALSKE